MSHGECTPAESPQAIHSALGRDEIALIDVREPAEYAVQRVAGALLFPLSTFDPRKLPVGARPLVLYCGTGARSAAAFESCRRAGVTIQSHMKGGLMAWRAAHLPVVDIDPASGKLRFEFS